MARQRKEKSAKDIKLKHPDRSGPDPTEKTLLQLAEERQLFQQAQQREKQLGKKTPGNVKNEDLLSPGEERFIEAVLYTATLAMVHFTFDVLVQHQYATEIDWQTVCIRTALAWLCMISHPLQLNHLANIETKTVFCIIFYPLHPHAANPILLPGLKLKYQHPLRQIIFFAMSALSGCYLVYITNTFGYLAVMKRAPPIGCLWIWAVVELDLQWAALSVAVAGGFLYGNGYSIK